MCRKQFSKVYPNVTIEQVWAAWENVNQWPSWDTELAACKLDQPFVAGSQFTLTPKGGPTLTITLTCVEPKTRFTDVCRFFGATLTDDHQLEATADGVHIRNTISLSGPLAGLWWWLVGRKVARSVPQQTDHLVQHAQQQ